MGKCWCGSVSSTCQNGDKNSADCLVCDAVMSTKSMARKLSRLYLYRTWLAKESRKYWGRVTQRALHSHRREGHVSRALGQTATAKDPHETKERHHVSHTTTGQKTGQSPTASPPHSAGASGA